MKETIPHLLSNYHIGLGAAGSRTEHQKMLARRYGLSVLKACTEGGHTHVDGSIYKGLHGGAGVVRTHNTNKTKDVIPINAFMCPVKTTDAQQAELTAIEKALEMMIQCKIEPQQHEHIFCDCKNAVNYVQDSFARPHKYRKTIQRIRENRTQLRNMGTTISVHWIPGHADIDGNELVDLVAKGAARLWSDEKEHYTDKIWTREGFAEHPNRITTVEKNMLF